MKVRIVKCSNPRLWYRDAVGGEFEAVQSIADAKDARVLSHSSESLVRFINHGDYEVVEPSWRTMINGVVSEGYQRQQADEWAVEKIRKIVREEIAEYNFHGRLCELESYILKWSVKDADSATIAGLIDRVKALEEWRKEDEKLVARAQELTNELLARRHT